jgi:hypothetical protein
MRQYELERWRGEIVREVQRLLIDLEELDDETEIEETGRSNQSVIDFYIPKGLRDIHRLPRPRL